MLVTATTGWNPWHLQKFHKRKARVHAPRSQLSEDCTQMLQGAVRIKADDRIRRCEWGGSGTRLCHAARRQCQAEPSYHSQQRHYSAQPMSEMPIRVLLAEDNSGDA